MTSKTIETELDLEGLKADLHNVGLSLQTLTKQGEDRIWRPCEAALPVIERAIRAVDLLAGLSRAPGAEDTNQVGAAEAEVGRYVYRRIERLMDAKPGSVEGAELCYLAEIAEGVEEYGEQACDGHPLGRFPHPSPEMGEISREEIARIIYEANPFGDQETDLDGRPVGPGYVISWDDLGEYDAGIYDGIMETARLILSKLNIDEGPSSAAAILAKFVDFEDRYDADKSVSDDEVRTATAEAKALLEGKAP